MNSRIELDALRSLIDRCPEVKVGEGGFGGAKDFRLNGKRIYFWGRRDDFGNGRGVLGLGVECKENVAPPTELELRLSWFAVLFVHQGGTTYWITPLRLVGQTNGVFNFEIALGKEGEDLGTCFTLTA